VTRATKSVSAVAFGVVLIIAGIYAWFGDVSLELAGVGLLTLLLGVAGLLSTQSRANLTSPHWAVCGVLALAIAFHVYQNVTTMSRDFALGWFLWALSPYALVLVLACFQGTRLPVIAGAALALAADVWNYYLVAQSTSSTAVLNFIWAPIWHTIVVVPIVTFGAWLVLRRRQTSSSQ
jgi:hypothetical protein